MTLGLKKLGVWVVAGFLMAQVALATAEPTKVPLDVNKATVEQLADLPYIGPKRAALIVERRQQKPFATVEELLEVKGVGPKILEQLKPFITVSGSAAVPKTN